tara:strand:- start:93 stop:401 length:309 start_codon:yes stop_codon:yes gene_type:complete
LIQKFFDHNSNGRSKFIANKGKLITVHNRDNNKKKCEIKKKFFSFFKDNTKYKKEIDQNKIGKINSENRYGDCNKADVKNGVIDNIKKVFAIVLSVNNFTDL